MSTVGTTVARLRAEFAASPRLRLGVWVIAAILLGHVAFVVQSDRVSVVAAGHAVAESRLARAEALRARDDWQERLDAALAAEQSLAGRMWRAVNEGLAQAAVREVVESMATRARLDRPRIELGVSRPVEDVPGLWQVQVQLVGNAKLGTAQRLLHAIATHPEKVVEERLNVVRRRNSHPPEKHVDMLLSAYFLIEGPGDTDGGAPR